ncbi:hypothetical protein KP509_23G047100 [Ceratopteris richardii]|uniref:50S ribosomal protein L12, chloroplastic n=1 Tax=Ceratopteris richardii TaxID=49495 RepID=A0A8T2S1T8_CERRI|nr:hypothetical protein KP509_23G047100 [Ceratopteris richardii]
MAASSYRTLTVAQCYTGPVASSSSRSQFIGQTLRIAPMSGRRSFPSISVCTPRAAVDTAKIEELGNKLKELTLEDARGLVEWLQNELGVSAASIAPVAVAAPGGAGPAAEAAPAVEEQTEFDVIIEEVPTAQRIAVIKVIRSLTTLGLKEAKDMIEGLPKPLKQAVSKEDAEEAKKQMEAAGAKCSIK